MDEEIAVIDFGSPHTQSIAKSLRRLNVFCRIYSHENPPRLTDSNIYIRGIILSSGSGSVNHNNAPQFDFDKYKTIPILGICYGAQLIAKNFSGKVETLDKNIGKSDFSTVELNLTHMDEDDPLFRNVEFPFDVQMSNHNNVISCGEGESLAESDDLEYAIFKIKNKDIYGVQFHPELDECQFGQFILQNFCVISHVTFQWQVDNILHLITQKMKQELFESDFSKKIKQKLKANENYIPRIIMPVSGGLNSTIGAYVLQLMVGNLNFYPVLIDNGFMRQGEIDEVQKTYKDLNFQNLRVIHAKDTFMSHLKGVSDTNEKKIRIGKIYLKLIKDEIAKIESDLKKIKKKKNRLFGSKKQYVNFIGQGTIYSDIMDVKHNESSIHDYYHNVESIAKSLNMLVMEPLKLLFKDDIRELGKNLGLPDHILNKQPFPAPGLSIRIVGEVTPKNLSLIQDVDFMTTQYLTKYGYAQTCWQLGTILLPNLKYDETEGDLTVEKKTIVVRSVNSVNGINATVHDIPTGILEGLAFHLCHHNINVGRVLFDVTPKPPATIEWF